MAQTAYPTGAVPATVTRWARMARVFAPPAVVGTLALNAYGASVSGLTVTIGRGISGVAEAWVRSFFHVLDTADWTVAVPANSTAQPRVDRIVIRWNPATETALITHVQGAPAASPVAPPLQQADTGVWDLPLWRFTVPANSGAPLTGLVDDRKWIDPATGSNTDVDQVPHLTSNWTRRSTALGNTMLSIAWSPTLRLFVAASISGVQSSPDGITWTQRSGISTSTVVWSPDRSIFVAAGGATTGIIQTSPDGITWTQRTTPNTNITWRGSCWSPQLGLFVLVGEGGSGNRIATSPDGITWTGRTYTTTELRSVAWAPSLGRFVAVTYPSGTTVPATQRIITSTDGVSWSSTGVQTADGLIQTATQFASVAWAPELNLFVAVAENTTANGRKVFTSTDGLTWFGREDASYYYTFQSVCWSPELKVFLATVSTTANGTIFGANMVWVSSNGITWTGRPLTLNEGAYGACWSPELRMFVLGGGNSIVFTSPTLVS